VPGTASGSNDKVRTILGDTPHVATHYMHASAPADACTLFRDWASEVRLRRGPKSVPTHDGPGGSSTHRGTRAKNNGNTRRTLVTAVSFRALAFDVFYHRRWLDLKGRFWSTVAEVVRLRSRRKSYDFSYLVRLRPPVFVAARLIFHSAARGQKQRLTIRSGYREGNTIVPCAFVACSQVWRPRLHSGPLYRNSSRPAFCE